MKFTLIILIFLFVTEIKSEEVLITQGKTQLSFTDIDGMAFMMPSDVREGFFDSPERIDKTLGTLLNMKHMYNYVLDSNLLDLKSVNKRVDESVSNFFAYDTSTDDIMQKDQTFKIIRNHMVVKEVYQSMQNQIISEITDDSVKELAEETYLLNSNDYWYQERRNLSYISLGFDEFNKDKKFEVINKIKEKLLSSDSTLETVFDEFKITESTIKIAKGIKGYYPKKEQQKFSKYIFSSDEVGVVNDILELKDKYIIAVVDDIIPKQKLKKDVAINSILNELKKDKAQSKFNNLLMELTKDDVEVNADAIRSLRSRYKAIN